MRYRKVDVRIWNDEKFCSFSDDGQLIFFFLMTHPAMTALGAMRATIPGLAAERGWDEIRFRDAIEDAIKGGMVILNERSNYLELRNFLKYNRPNGPNSVKNAWVDCLDLIPECPERDALIVRCREFLLGCSPEFLRAIGHGIRHAFGMPSVMPCDIQEQDQEQDQEQESKSKVVSAKPPTTIPAFEAFWKGARIIYKDLGMSIGSKAQAQKAWKQLSGFLPTPDILIQKLDRQAEAKKSISRTGKDPIQLKHLVGWIKYKCWSDDPDPMPKQFQPEPRVPISVPHDFGAKS